VKTNLVFSPGAQDRTHLVLRPFPRQGGQEEPADLSAIHQVLRPDRQARHPGAETDHSWTWISPSVSAAPLRKRHHIAARPTPSGTGGLIAGTDQGPPQGWGSDPGRGAAPRDRRGGRQAREAIGKAQTIEDAVYDLKAVNPCEKKVGDTRTPAQLLEAIAEKGREVDAALERLRALL